ncbi:hypothetical protein FHG87_019908 [Trinorchestia longiramus]|nr:hypothetical protein FHG87_019908 [Trinorchestia longiramus]
MYDDTDYDGELSCVHKEINRCRNLLDSCGDMASSLRYAGSPYGLNDNYYNLYDSEDFIGAEFRGNTDVDFFPNLDASISSLIITGQSGWTFYTGVGQTEGAVCVYPTQQESDADGIFFNYGHYASVSTAFNYGHFASVSTAFNYGHYALL